MNIEELKAENERLRNQIENLHSVMVRAAEEIAEHWDAHCDKDGNGPVNLLRRLEEGIPSEYAYKAGDFARLRAEVERLRGSGVPLVWISEVNLKRAMVAVKGERAEVAPDKEDGFTVPLYTHPAPAVPEGWIIEQGKHDAAAIVVQKYGVGGYAAREDGTSGIAESILYSLAKDILSATQQPEDK